MEKNQKVIHKQICDPSVRYNNAHDNNNVSVKVKEDEMTSVISFEEWDERHPELCELFRKKDAKDKTQNE